MSKYFIPTFVLIALLVLISLFGCNPTYRVTHHGYGVYSDTIRVIYNSGNKQDIYIPY